MIKPEPAGFQRLVDVDVSSGWLDGTSTLWVPQRLAAQVNEARRLLRFHPTQSDAWVQACVRKAESIEADDEAASPAAASPPPAPAPAPAAPPPARVRPRHGRKVFVIARDQLEQRLADTGKRVNLTSAEKKTEAKLIESLIALGEHRWVALPVRWRHGLAALRERMPNFTRVIARIEAACAIAERTRTALRLPPVLLVGPPGVGKTHFSLALAKLLGVPHFLYALESAETVSTLTGSDKHWWQSEPGQLWRLIVLGEFANPVIVLDELDKSSRGNQYQPTNALHAVLEPATASTLRDKSTDLCFDASYVIYMATCNQLGTVEPSLRSRFEIHLIDEPGPRESVAIARSIVQQELAELKLARHFARPSGEVVQQLALLGGPRRMHKVLHAAVGRALLAGRDELIVADLLDGNVPGAAPGTGAGHDARH